jgi:hypothetical protein
MKVYLDEDLSPTVARILRDHGVDAVNAHEVGKVQLDDRAQLAEATGDGRAIVTVFPSFSGEPLASPRSGLRGPMDQRVGLPARGFADDH